MSRFTRELIRVISKGYEEAISIKPSSGTPSKNSVPEPVPLEFRNWSGTGTELGRNWSGTGSKSSGTGLEVPEPVPHQFRNQFRISSRTEAVVE